MEKGQVVNKYQFLARFRDSAVEWNLALETEDGERHLLPIRDGDDVPILMKLCHCDETLYFDPSSKVLSTGWNNPGEDD